MLEHVLTNTMPQAPPPETPDAGPGAPPRRTRHVWLYRGIGIVAVGMAAVGAILPLVPTTIFLLIALWAFAKGSPEWADRVRADHRFGPYIRDWEERGAIPSRAKVAAVVMMSASWIFLLATTHSLILAGGVGGLLLAVAAFIVSRPSV